jgi:hypothetical protein
MLSAARLRHRSDSRPEAAPVLRARSRLRRHRLSAALAMILLSGVTRAATFDAGSEAELIQAINDANAAAGADVIDVTADITLSAALPMITDALTIEGIGGQRAITRDNTGSNACSPSATNAFRPLDANAYLALLDLSLQGGCNLADQGGALRIRDAALHVERSLITGNQVFVENPYPYQYGLGIGGGVAVLYGSAVLIDSTVSSNSTHGTLGSGGGIAVYHGDLDLTRSTISGNLTSGAGPFGAGVYAIGDYANGVPGTVTIADSAFTYNRADGDFAYGGGLSAFAEEVTITDSQFLNNQALTGPHASGAGINIQNPHMPTVNRIERTVIAYNAVTSGLGGAGAGIHHVGGVFSLVDSAVIHNTIDADAKAVGGGMMIEIAMADVTNSTVSGNEANAPNTPDVGGGGGGISILGEGSDFTLLALFNSTVAANRAPTVTSGGIRAKSDSLDSVAPLVLVESTIVAGNEGIDGLDEIGVEPDTASDIVAIHSLIEGNVDAGGGTFTPDAVTSALMGQDPQLQPLAYNGGSVQTQAVQPTSPAIDQGTNTQALPFDQRGAPWLRIVGVAADIGAYELDTDRIFAGDFD